MILTGSDSLPKVSTPACACDLVCEKILAVARTFKYTQTPLVPEFVDHTTEESVTVIVLNNAPPQMTLHAGRLPGSPEGLCGQAPCLCLTWPSAAAPVPQA